MPIVILIPLIVAGAAASFWLWGPFSWRVYSDRIFWGGIGAAVAGGLGTLASLGSYSTLGTPNVITAPADARVAHARVADHMRSNAGRYMFIVQMVITGAACIGISAAVEVLSR